MSEKNASKQTKQELTGQEIADKELASVSDVMFDDAMKGLRGAFRFGVAVAEKMEDNNASFWGGILGDEAREKHTKKLEDEAMAALKHGRVDAAKHLLKRDAVYTLGTQGFDDEDSQRLLKEISLLQELEKEHAKVARPVQKPYGEINISMK